MAPDEIKFVALEERREEHQHGTVEQVENPAVLRLETMRNAGYLDFTSVKGIETPPPTQNFLSVFAPSNTVRE